MAQTIDNQLYEQFGDGWWQPDGPVRLLHEMNPARFDFFQSAVGGPEKIVGLRVLDVGCGGGLVAEKFAQLGAIVTGVDISASSLAVAQRHAQQQGLDITYLPASGDCLPFPSESFDLVVCCDFLEHISDRLDDFLTEMSRVLRPGGLFLYDTINRTAASRLIAIWILQDWLQIVPRQTHLWRMFIQPVELEAALQRVGITPKSSAGMLPAAGPLRVAYTTLRYHQVGGFRLSRRQKPLGYVGYGYKPISD